MRVTRTDESVIPRAVGDSLLGWIATSGADSSRIAIPGDSVRNIETQDLDLWRTRGTIFFIGSLALTAIVLSLVVVLVNAAR
jgi:hypothetical protein